ncbi:MAG: SusD/RagB family nutrient-binding outer membrane lipoprotein [Firmicutes bacterium]|nr:SusD/RagB family nutrient-binding outer membrane lipoprotein [Bacillota bacterium]
MKNIIKYAAIVTGLFLSYSCTGDFEEMNKSQNSLDTIEDPNFYFPRIQQKAIHAYYGEYQVGVNLYTNQYAQYVSNTATSWATDRYAYQDSWAMNGYWTPYYLYVLKYMLQIKEICEDRSDFQQMYHIARIMTAEGTGRITDVFGDIPYSEASRGIDKPKYDSQKDIYYDILKELKEATDALEAANYGGVQQKSYGSQDLVYGGSADSWICLGNSLRLRYAMRLSYVDPEKAKAEVEDALSKRLMTEVSHSAGYKPGSSGDSEHPMTVICHWNEFRLSETLVDAYKELSTVQDQRALFYAGYTQASTNDEDGQRVLQGLRNGLSATELGDVNSTNSNVWGLKWYPVWNAEGEAPSGRSTDPYYFMLYSEVCFLKAEAALRGWGNAGDAQTNYIEGIQASFAETRLNVDESYYTTDEDETYYTTGSVAWNEADDFETKLKKIITQKWISMFPNGNEAWAEFRRTGYPELRPIAQSDEPSINPANGEFIKKLRYSEIERRENTANSTASSLNQGQGDGPNVRVWWDTGRYK